MTPPPEPRLETRVVNGHERAYVIGGRGPAILLLHGLGCDSRTWRRVIGRLTRSFTVVAPDLLGHGRSAKPRADYSLGGYANGMRDLLAVLDIDRVTVVGHSFGGGVAMQVAYQFPSLTDRLCLVAPGGLGADVSPVMRALTLPGAGTALAVASSAPVLSAARVVGRLARAARLPGTADVLPALDVLERQADVRVRDAFLHVLRSVVDRRGQIVSMQGRAYLTANMPTCVIWGADDTVIPVRHTEIVRSAMPGARVEVIPNAGHFPHEERPDAFVRLLRDFIATTAPSVHDPEVWRDLLRNGPPSADGNGGLVGADAEERAETAATA